LSPKQQRYPVAATAPSISTKNKNKIKMFFKKKEMFYKIRNASDTHSFEI